MVRALLTALRHRRSPSGTLPARLASPPNLNGRPQPILVAVVAERPLYGEALARAVGSERRRVRVVDRRRREMILAERPQVVVLDLPLAEGLSFCRWCARVAPEARVITLSAAHSEEEVLRWAESGLAGCIPGNASVGDLIETIERVVRGEAVYPPDIVASVLKRAALLTRDGRRPRRVLTSRQLEVVRLIDQGLSNKEIAQRLGIEVATVKNHVHNILERLDVRRRAEAALRMRALLGLEVLGTISVGFSFL
jgi:two-component system, NarL family, nitrate/nitrite response regulator NarL